MAARVANSNWSVTNAPAVNVIASVTKAAAGANRRNVCLSLDASITINTAVGAAPGSFLVVLRDGATGAGTILWSSRCYFSLGAAFSDISKIQAQGLFIVGSVNTPMTLEFQAAGGTNVFETVAMTGFVIQ